ncbi:MAG TPA: hypothetical protein VJT67_07290 [Longimicrobiaceae bacterium]|nr:hypothetical protein [Longimicrobiaceae bacterium]
MPGRSGTTRRKDANHDEIAEACRRIPAEVYSSAHVGGGFPDLLVCFRDRIVLLEVKMPGHGLTAAEARFAERWPVRVVTTPEQAVAAVVEAARP